MHPLRLAILQAHAKLVTPHRWQQLRELAVLGTAPISVSFYHRVADSHPNDWTISCDGFRRHIDYCQRHLELVDLAEVQRRVRSSDSPSAALSITFDDGYRDNCDFALPLLIERRIPCTYFVCSENIRRQRPFAHDEAAGQPLAVNTVRQIREMSDAGIEIGCHTQRHVDFARVYDPLVIRSEIIEAKDDLEQIIGRPVRYFAFPFGMPSQLTQAAIEAVHEAGYAGFCSAFGAYNLVGRDAFHIRRFHADPEFPRLMKWLSFNPIKVRQEPEIRYFLPPFRSFEETLAKFDSSSLLPTH